MITVAEVKALLQIQDTSKDVLLESLLPVAVAMIDAHCNRSFADETETWPVALNFRTAILVKYLAERSGKLETSESFPGGYSVNYKSEDEIMASFNSHRRPYL